MSEHQPGSREALRALVEKWRKEAERHKVHGDCYRIGQGWSMEQCADELAALSAPLASSPEQEQIKLAMNPRHRCSSCDEAAYDRATGWNDCLAYLEPLVASLSTALQQEKRERENDSWDHAESRDALILRAEAAEAALQQIERELDALKANG